MEKAELERFRVILEARLEQLGLPFRARSAIAVESLLDDECVAANWKAVTIRVLQSQTDERHLIERALHRITLGTFGECSNPNCEEPIAPARLKAIPWAPFCAKCQTAAEQAVPVQSRGTGASIGYSRSTAEELP